MGGHRFRIDDEGVTWQYGLQEGSLEKLDKTIVEILDGDDAIIRTFAQIISVGDVGAMTCLEMPKERMLRQCPKCGHTEA